MQQYADVTHLQGTMILGPINNPAVQLCVANMHNYRLSPDSFRYQMHQFKAAAIQPHVQFSFGGPGRRTASKSSPHAISFDEADGMEPLHVGMEPLHVGMASRHAAYALATSQN